MQFFETSARSGQGIQEAFESIAKAIIEKLESEKKVDDIPLQRKESMIVRSQTKDELEAKQKQKKGCQC